MSNGMKNIVIILLLAVVGVLGIYVFLQNFTSVISVDNQPTESDVATDLPTGDDTTDATEVTKEEETDEPEGMTIIGTSVDGKDIEAYHFGAGEQELLFIGGIHGGYAWNTVLLAHELIDYLEASPEIIPDDVSVTVIPVLNPDGLAAVVGDEAEFSAADTPKDHTQAIPGRFNANKVDLNRNFDCEWSKSSTWQDRTVSGGDEAFSEPESQAIRDYVAEHSPTAVVVWYSAAGGVFASNCRIGVLDETKDLTNAYAKASGYKAYEDFDFYEINGDMVNWLAKVEIPAVSVLLTDHRSVEWNKNKAGIEAILKYYE